MTITTRTLGGSGADVTIPGYGAMELGGRLRGPGIADEDPGRLLNAVLDGGIAMGVFDVFQIPYSAVQRDHEELITEATAAGAGTLIRGQVASQPRRAGPGDIRSRGAR